jgi:hypothetical protein
MKLERVVQQRTEKVNAPPTRSFRTAVPREDELSSAASHMGQPQGDDPFAAQMGEATRRPSIDGEGMDSVLQTAPLAIESVDDELADETGGDSKQRRIENALQSGDTIEDCFVGHKSVDSSFSRTDDSTSIALIEYLPCHWG